MDLPDVAVEAAARAAHETFQGPLGLGWDEIQENQREDCRAEARASLEAAMPILTASRTVTTVEELDALPDEAIIRDVLGLAWQRDDGDPAFPGAPWSAAGGDYPLPSAEIPIPATVLYTPEVEA